MKNKSNQSDSNEVRQVRCVVACYNSNGSPDLYSVIVKTDEKGYNNGEHYAAAERAAEESGYEGPFVKFDENDAAGGVLMPLFQWDTAEHAWI